MGKAKNPPKQASNESRAVLRMYRSSPQKLNLLAQQIRGLPVQKAMDEMPEELREWLEENADEVEDGPNGRRGGRGDARAPAWLRALRLAQARATTRIR